jgi:hypothetical protein
MKRFTIDVPESLHTRSRSVGTKWSALRIVRIPQATAAKLAYEPSEGFGSLMTRRCTASFATSLASPISEGLRDHAADGFGATRQVFFIPAPSVEFQRLLFSEADQ